MLTLLYVHSYSTFIQGIFRLQNCKERTFFLFQGIFSCIMITMISTICKLSKKIPATQPKLKKKTLCTLSRNIPYVQRTGMKKMSNKHYNCISVQREFARFLSVTTVYILTEKLPSFSA